MYARIVCNDLVIILLKPLLVQNTFDVTFKGNMFMISFISIMLHFPHKKVILSNNSLCNKEATA